MRAALLAALFAFACFPAVGGAGNASPWRQIDARGATAGGTPGRVVALDRAALQGQLAAGMVELPLPEGGVQRFDIQRTSVLAPGLQAEMPRISTWSGRAGGDRSQSVQLVDLPAGIGAQVLGDQGAWYIAAQPDGTYVAYRLADAAAPALAEPAEHVMHQPAARSLGRMATTPGSEPAARSSGAQLRTLRMALSTTGEFTQMVGGKAAAEGITVQAVAYLNGIFERDFAVRLQLVAGNNDLVYADPATDPFPNGDTGSYGDLWGVNQQNLDAVLGAANYDVGHVFGVGGGGVGAIAGVGVNGVKGAGASLLSLPNSEGWDGWFVNVVAHEVGHQFGGRHTFSGASGPCVASFAAASSVEPGAGSTIMSYGGGGNCYADNFIAAASGPTLVDPYFHASTYDYVRAHLETVPAAGTSSATGNSEPTITTPGSAFTIPPLTPFRLQATGSDGNPGDSLTYTWEQMDVGPQQSLLPNPETVRTAGAMFRSRPATAVPDRFFPPLPWVLSGATNQATGLCGHITGTTQRKACRSELLPASARTMNFRATVRDNASGGGGVNSADTAVTVAGSTPFAMTSHGARLALASGSTQSIAWNTAGTAVAPYSTPTVDIAASRDGGSTWDVLADDTANDGSQDVVMPALTSAPNQFRLMVRAQDNVFYDVNDSALTLTTTPDAVIGVDLSTETESMSTGGTRQLTYAVTPVNASNQAVTWATSNAAVATVSSVGVVTAVGRGTATIAVTTADGAFTDTVAVTVRQQVTGVQVSPTTATLATGATRQLSGSVVPANANNSIVSWTTSNAAVATVGASGLVGAVAPGTATITLTSSDGGFTATSTITVIARVATAGISLATPPSTMARGATAQLSATVAPPDATDTRVTWTSSNTSVATVSAAGLVTASASNTGTATITATTTDGGHQATATIQVITPVLVTGISLAPDLGSVNVGATLSLTATVSPADATDQRVTWTSGNPSVATVSSTGVVTGVSAGTAIITGRTIDQGMWDMATVTVLAVPVSGVSVDPTTATMGVGSTRQIAVTVAPANATNRAVTWASSDAGVATVSASGLVTAVSAGSATITATTADGGRTAATTVTVTAPIAVTGVTLGPASATVAAGATRQLAATVAPANATNQAVTWSSSNQAVATVTGTGLVTAIAAGTAAITVTTADGSFTAVAAITVSLAPGTPAPDATPPGPTPTPLPAAPAPTAPVPTAPPPAALATQAPGGGSPAPFPPARQISPAAPAMPATIAIWAKMTVPPGAKVKLTVPKSQAKTCAVRGGRVVATGTGTCTVTVTVTSKGRTTRKTVAVPVRKK